MSSNDFKTSLDDIGKLITDPLFEKIKYLMRGIHNQILLVTTSKESGYKSLELAESFEESSSIETSNTKYEPSTQQYWNKTNFKKHTNIGMLKAKIQAQGIPVYTLPTKGNEVFIMFDRSMVPMPMSTFNILKDEPFYFLFELLVHFIPPRFLENAYPSYQAEHTLIARGLAASFTPYSKIRSSHKRKADEIEQNIQVQEEERD